MKCQTGEIIYHIPKWYVFQNPKNLNFLSEKQFIFFLKKLQLVNTRLILIFYLNSKTFVFYVALWMDLLLRCAKWVNPPCLALPSGTISEMKSFHAADVLSPLSLEVAATFVSTKAKYTKHLLFFFLQTTKSVCVGRHFKSNKRNGHFLSG